MKRCSRCGFDKIESDFNSHARRSDGLQVYCRQCQNGRDRELYSTSPERRRKLRSRTLLQRTVARRFVATYLQSHSCVDCGEADPVVLDFDHVRGDKRKEISRLVISGTALKVLVAEIQKCDIRCANCHRRVTHQRRLRSRSTGRTMLSESIDPGSNPGTAAIRPEAQQERAVVS